MVSILLYFIPLDNRLIIQCGIYFVDRMGCGSSFDASDGPRTVVVFGSTGLLGGAIARRLLQEPFLYKVRCVTRRSSSEKARELAEHGMRNASLFLNVF